MFAGPLGRSTFTPPKSSFDSPLYGLVSLRRSHLFPAALPTIIAGLRTALAIAFIMVYVSEIAGASAGLGYRISITHLAYRIDTMVAALVALAVAGALADFVFSALTRWIFPWTKLPEKG